MYFLKLAAFVGLLATVECADVSTYDGACTPGTDTCSFASTECFDRGDIHKTTCACTAAGHQPNAGANGCETVIALGSACTDARECVPGAACLDSTGDGTINMCLCSPGAHASGTACVLNPGTACTQYGTSCTSNAQCVALTGQSALQDVCQCNSGYFSDGVNCVAGASFITASTIIIFAAFVVSRLFF